MNSSNTEKYVDLLDEDKSIAGQKFVCLSFVSPEKILKQKEMFYFEKFIKQFEFNKTMEKFDQFLNFISFKYNLKQDIITEDFKEFIKEEKEKLFFSTVEDDYKTYIEKHDDKLQAEFNEIYNFQTNTRGIKVRGSFATQEEAELRCKMIREFDPNHDVYVGPVGVWVPFHPEAYKTGRVEYLEEELNGIMQEKVKNETTAKDLFDKRVRDTKENAIKENIEKARISGNKLTQDINEKGELVSANSISNSIEKNILDNSTGGTISSADIRKELFEGDNVVMDKNSDHGLSELLKREKERNTIHEEDEGEEEEHDKNTLTDTPNDHTD